MCKRVIRTNKSVGRFRENSSWHLGWILRMSRGQTRKSVQVGWTSVSDPWGRKKLATVAGQMTLTYN